MHDATWLLRMHARRRLARLADTDAGEVQRRVLLSLIRRAKSTVFGRDHCFDMVRSLDDYRRRVPLRDYEAFWDSYWSDSFPRLAGRTWPGAIPWLAVSSGTTRGATKFIPVSREMRRANTRAGADLLVHHVAARPRSRILSGRSFMLGGSTGLVRRAPGVHSGDLSGIAAAAMPWWARLRYFPPKDLEAIDDWEVKIDRFAKRSLGETITSVAGTPSWLLIYFDHLLEIAGASGGRIAEVYPDLELLVHGGVAWQPYRDRFAALLEGSRAETREVYPASEGFLAVADRGDGDGLRLLLDNGIFFEFVPVEELGGPNPDCRWVADAEPGVNYALVVTTCAGLWRYVIGDTVELVGSDPPRVRVTGRTSYMLSAFGEHLIGAELEEAVAAAAAAVGTTVNDFSVGSLFSGRTGERGGHLYVVEFAEDGMGEARVRRFADHIDSALRDMNEDYAAHRADGFGLEAPRIQILEPGGFAAWMRSRGRLGGQNKVPRVIGDPGLFDSLRSFAEGRNGKRKM